MIKKIALMMAVCFGMLFLFGAQTAPSPSLTITWPKPGQKLDRHFSVSGQVENMQNRCVIVRVEGFGVTHHFALQKSNVFQDGFLAIQPGEHEVRITVWFEASPQDLLFERTLRLNVPKPTPLTEQQFDICRPAAREDVSVLELQYSGLLYQKRRDPSAHAALERVSDRLAIARVYRLFDHCNAYGNLGTAYASVFDLDRAVGAVKIAEKHYEQNEYRLNDHPLGRKIDWRALPVRVTPLHLYSAANIYTRANNFEAALAYWNKIAEFYDARSQVVTDPEIKRSCVSSKAAAYTSIGDLHMLLAGNRAAQREWHEKANKLRRSMQ